MHAKGLTAPAATGLDRFLASSHRFGAAGFGDEFGI